MTKKLTLRERVPLATLKQEKMDILQFALDSVKPEANNRGFMHEIMERYNLWRIAHGKKPSDLSIDGFGRLFPKHFCRATLCRNGEVYKGVRGIAIK